MPFCTYSLILLRTELCLFYFVSKLTYISYCDIFCKMKFVFFHFFMEQRRSFMHKPTFRRLIALGLTLTFSLLPALSLAHSGRTDSNGGHRDNKNKSGLGSYHYHCGGHPAHLHTNGVCPYSSKKTSSDSSSSARSSSNGSSSKGSSQSTSSSSSKTIGSSINVIQNTDDLMNDFVTQGLLTPTFDPALQQYCISLFSGQATKLINVRESPSSKSKRLGQIKSDEEFWITEKYYNSNWHQVLYQGQLGYVYAKYCKLADDQIKTVIISTQP